MLNGGEYTPFSIGVWAGDFNSLKKRYIVLWKLP